MIPELILLQRAVERERFDGRIEAIRKAFADFKKALEKSLPLRMWIFRKRWGVK